ncbi:unnamed protein product [Lymnaea stagnalis]|uniref:SRA1/Sec31 domain-containing protein n=1 Tax=Lymnaea stagnalis TaxID=6523 RepID=A0AAV2H1K3_LYMST
MLDDQWREDKLSEGAKIKLGCLACALKNKDLKQADNLHLALMVDHISEVSQWMVGVKRLINELKLSASSSATPNSKKVAALSSIESVADTRQVPGAVFLDTEELSTLKPVLMPEALVPGVGVVETDEGAPHSGEVSEPKQLQEQEKATGNTQSSKSR